MALSRVSVRSKLCAFVERYRRDLRFKGHVGVYQGMAVNFVYVAFRAVMGIRYASAWFISMAVYYLVLGGLRAYIISCAKKGDSATEWCCYRHVALSLFLLNVPMGGMILMMVLTNSGYTYPGYVIYASALYTFYAMGLSIANLVRYRKLGSPILSAAKVLNFVSAMMSILGLQTAMIAAFSHHGEGYRMMMNAITGGCVWGIVIVIAIFMLVRGRRAERDGTV